MCDICYVKLFIDNYSVRKLVKKLENNLCHCTVAAERTGLLGSPVVIVAPLKGGDIFETEKGTPINTLEQKVKLVLSRANQ